MFFLRFVEHLFGYVDCIDVSVAMFREVKTNCTGASTKVKDFDVGVALSNDFKKCI